MAIIFPVAFPSAPAPRSVVWRPQSVVAITESPFSLSQQVQAHQGQRWVVEMDFPPMTRAQAEEFTAFILSLNGREGTFLLPAFGGKTPRGPATGSPVVSGASQTGQVLNVTGWTTTELVTNGRFTTDLSSWTIDLDGSTGGTIVWDAGMMKLTQGSNSVWIGAWQAITLTKGLIYSVGGDRIAVSGGGECRIGVATFNTIDGSLPDLAALVFTGTETGGKRATFRAPSTGTFYMRITEGSAPTNSSSVDSMSVRRAPLLLGDYFQLSSGATARLHKLMKDAPIDIGGLGPLDIWPRLRESPTDASALIVQTPTGLFRLAQNENPWDINTALHFGISLVAMEAL